MVAVWTKILSDEISDFAKLLPWHHNNGRTGILIHHSSIVGRYPRALIFKTSEPLSMINTSARHQS